MVQPSKGVKINWTLKTEPGSQDKNNVKINQLHETPDLADFAQTKHITVRNIICWCLAADHCWDQSEFPSSHDVATSGSFYKRERRDNHKTNNNRKYGDICRATPIPVFLIKISKVLAISNRQPRTANKIFKIFSLWIKLVRTLILDSCVHI